MSTNDDTNWYDKYEGTALRDYLILWQFLQNYKSIFNVYNVTTYLAAMGLGVAKKYRKRGIATEMLKARWGWI